MATASELVTKALDAVSISSKVWAKQLKVSDTALRRYGYGERNPAPGVLPRLAGLLRRQAKQLQRLAKDVDRFARKYEKGRRLRRGRRGRRTR